MNNDTYQKRKQEEADILSALGGVHGDSPVLQAMMMILARQLSQETAAALQPNLSNEARQYNAGRSAALCDFEIHLNRLLQKAHAVAA